jgi:aerobic-type carbon monoxide dehydrogenase small subunit (CoxS/CutS family)
MASPRQDSPGSFTRRSFIKGASAAAASGAILTAGDPRTGSAAETRYGAGYHEIKLEINGESRSVKIETRTTLLDAVRERADLTGSKKVCDRGSCGACTMLLDGEPVNACMILALDTIGHEITTIESLSADGNLHPLQEAFVQCDALQCGYCTPGMVMASQACLARNEHPTLDEIKHELSGNICRCGTYGRIFEAVQRTARGEITTGRAVR